MTITTRTSRTTEILLILHEQALRPSNLEYEYMTGRLIDDLDSGRFGRPLTDDAYGRATLLGERLRGYGYSTIYTDNFITPLETARVIAENINDAQTSLMIDRRIRESRLFYLDRQRHQSLVSRVQSGHANAILDDWMDRCPNDLDDLVDGHTELWNDVVRLRQGQKVILILHLEGFLLYPTLLLGLQPSDMSKFNIPRGNPVHILLSDQAPLITFNAVSTCINDANSSPPAANAPAPGQTVDPTTCFAL
jgi:broad specificity phosphatase PhoE